MKKRLTTTKQREAIAGLKASVFMNKTPQQVEDWINTNVTDLASAKTALIYLAKALLYMAKNSGLSK
jgi:hypothetical protein